ncbi:MAG: ester cyclase [Chloroflexia bacterium]|nr:ester cyclase [Chloroflexia bacterium]
MVDSSESSGGSSSPCPHAPCHRRFTIDGPLGVFLGVAATGVKITARGVQIGRFENGKLVERWGSSDQLGILQQLGAAPVSTN